MKDYCQTFHNKVYVQVGGKTTRIGVVGINDKEGPFEITLPFKPEKVVLNYLEDTLAVIRQLDVPFHSKGLSQLGRACLNKAIIEFRRSQSSASESGSQSLSQSQIVFPGIEDPTALSIPIPISFQTQ